MTIIQDVAGEWNIRFIVQREQTQRERAVTGRYVRRQHRPRRVRLVRARASQQPAALLGPASLHLLRSLQPCPDLGKHCFPTPSPRTIARTNHNARLATADALDTLEHERITESTRKQRKYLQRLKKAA